MRIPSLYAVALAVCFSAPALVGAAEPEAGSILFSQGITTSQRTGEAARIVGKGEKVQAGEVLSTGASSFAVVELKDGSRMTLRPGTVFAVERYSEQAGSESAVMRLFKGGLRAITGFISKRNPNGYAVRTETATIGIRGTDFDARLCAADCAKDASGFGPRAAAPRAPQSVAARVVSVQGQATATYTGSTARPLANGAPVYAGDTVETTAGGTVVIAFRDDTRVTLQPGTRFAVDRYTYTSSSGEGNAFFRLLKGGLRALTGSIAKTRPQGFVVQTTTATIGIRGTGFDATLGVNCDSGSGGVGGTGVSAPSTADCVFANTWQGTIELTNDKGTQVVETGRSGFVGGPNEAPVGLPSTPRFMEENPAPRPDKVPVDLKNLFGTDSADLSEPGLYVWVRDGHVALESDGKVVDLGRDESAALLTGAAAPVRLAETPIFLELDRTPKPDQVIPGATIAPRLNLDPSGPMGVCP